MKKWEYKFIKNPNESQLNEAGLEGWELVSVTTVSEDHFPDAYFKRPLIEEEPKQDWRVGLIVKPKLRTNPKYYERGKVVAVHPSGHGGIVDPAGVLMIETLGSKEMFLARAEDWQTA